MTRDTDFTIGLVTAPSCAGINCTNYKGIFLTYYRLSVDYFFTSIEEFCSRIWWLMHISVLSMGFSFVDTTFGGPELEENTSVGWVSG